MQGCHQTGDIYSVVTYIWMFAMSLDGAPYYP